MSNKVDFEEIKELFAKLIKYAYRTGLFVLRNSSDNIIEFANNMKLSQKFFNATYLQ